MSLADQAEHALLDLLAERTVAQNLADIRAMDAARLNG